MLPVFADLVALTSALFPVESKALLALDVALGWGALLALASFQVQFLISRAFILAERALARAVISQNLILSALSLASAITILVRVSNKVPILTLWEEAARVTDLVLFTLISAKDLITVLAIDWTQLLTFSEGIVRAPNWALVRVVSHRAILALNARFTSASLKVSNVTVWALSTWALPRLVPSETVAVS